jgi:hypothetical protein
MSAVIPSLHSSSPISLHSGLTAIGMGMGRQRGRKGIKVARVKFEFIAHIMKAQRNIDGY